MKRHHSDDEFSADAGFHVVGTGSKAASIAAWRERKEAEAFAELVGKLQRRKWRKTWLAKPENRKKFNAWRRAWTKLPHVAAKFAAYGKAYRKRPEVRTKDVQRKRDERKTKPEACATYQKNYRQGAKYKAWRDSYYADYNHTEARRERNRETRRARMKCPKYRAKVQAQAKKRLQERKREGYVRRRSGSKSAASGSRGGSARARVK